MPSLHHSVGRSLIDGLLVLCVLAAIIGAPPVEAFDGHWQPADVFPAEATLSTVLARVEQERGPVGASYTERLRIIAAGLTFGAQATVSGENVRYDTALAGETYRAGRSAGIRWRQNPAGLVRQTRSDIQGDPLDRWPLSPFPIAAGDCTLIGATRGSHPEWVVQNSPRGDIMHWFYVDESTGAIDREVARDGSAVFTTTFDDFRSAVGARRPFHWQIAGFGGTADIYVDALASTLVKPAEVAIPVSPANLGAAADTNLRLPAQFRRDTIYLDVTVNGSRGRFILDTGTTQIVLSAAAAQRFGIHTDLTHGSARRLDIGAVSLHNVPITTVPSIFGIDGLLGYDFFVGSIVHINFAQQFVEIGPRAGFQPPPDTTDLVTSFVEGIPLATAELGGQHGARFALDTGSQELLVPRYFWEQRGLDRQALHLDETTGRRPQTNTFLEGPVLTVAARLPGETAFAGQHFESVFAQVEQTNLGPTIEIPFDAILGTDVLAKFEWWFDYTGGHAWTRFAPAADESLPMSSATSRLITLWVSAPMEMRSTPL